MDRIEIPGLDQEEIECLFTIATSEHKKNPMQSDFTLDFYVNSAWIGMMDAKKRVDKSDKRWRGYVGLRMRGAIKDALRNWDNVPRLMRQRGEAKPEIRFSTMEASAASRFKAPNNEPAPGICDILQLEAPTEYRPDEDFWHQVEVAVGKLSTRILRLYYINGITMSEIGRRIGYSQSRVSQMIASAKNILRATLAEAA